MQTGPVQTATFQPQHTQGHVLCCLCGVAIPPNPSNMCVNCIRSQVDITEGIQKQVSILWCKECGRYLQPPKHWIRAELESRELLTFCIKRIKGLQKVKLVDAGFVWTEPHARRLKVKLTIQAEVFNGAILQQVFVVELIVETHMCPDCTRSAANPNTWTACVQVRQHIEHKRTFMYLEQLILKHGAASSCLSIRGIHEGVDFFFGKRSHAIKFIDFLSGVVPTRHRGDKQLVSHNEQNATYNYKYTFSVEIVPICKDDLVCLPTKLAGSLGSIGPLVLCLRVTNTLTLINPSTLQSAQVEADKFWRNPFRPVLMARALTEYVVLDIELLDGGAARGGRGGRFALADAQVARSADLGSNDASYTVRTHLGHVLHAGDTVLGYDMTRANLVDDELDKYTKKGFALPDVVLVRKSYDEHRRRRRARGQQRPWKLRRLDGADAAMQDAPEQQQRGRRAAQALAQGAGHDDDVERFLQELEEDPDMRAKVALFRDPAFNPALERQRREDAMSDSEAGDVPEVPLEELLDEMAALQLERQQAQQHSEDKDDDHLLD